MKYISIDIETTGLDHYNCDILQIGMAFEDTNTDIPLVDLPNLELWIDHNELTFEPYALQMHERSGLLNQWQHANRVTMEEAMLDIETWLFSLGYELNDDKKFKFVVAGKNYNSFDKLFLHGNYEWTELIDEHHRTIDPAMLYIDWENDKVPPSLDKCLKRAGFNTTVTHYALEDALDVIKVVRVYYGGL